jgi:cell division protein FtsL
VNQVAHNYSTHKRVQEYNPIKHKQLNKLNKKVSFSGLEKIIFLAVVGTIIFGSMKVVGNYAAIYEVNKDIQKVKVSIESHEKMNSDIRLQVSELSTYERIWEKASQLGLTLNENNVKVVQE